MFTWSLREECLVRDRLRTRWHNRGGLQTYGSFRKSTRGSENPDLWNGIVMMNALKVAILYAGRWYGRAGKHYVANHLDNLIKPAMEIAQVTVFLVTSHDQWCAASRSSDTAALEAEVRAIFGIPRLYALLVPEPPVVDVWGSGLVRAAQGAAMKGGGKGGHASKFKIDQLLSYMRQFTNVARAEALRRQHGPHDLVIKARLDVLYNSVVDLAPLWRVLSSEPQSVFAPRAYEGSFSPDYSVPQWRDWNLVLSELGAEALYNGSDLSNATQPLYNGSRRCYGFCVEEQVQLQLELSGCSYRALPWNLSLHRIYHRGSGETEAARAERLAQLAMQSTDGHKWRSEQGLSWLSPWCDAKGGREVEPTPGAVQGSPQTWG